VNAMACQGLTVSMSPLNVCKFHWTGSDSESNTNFWLIHHNDEIVSCFPQSAVDHSPEPTHWLSSILRVFSSWAERSFSSRSCCKIFLSSYPHLLSFESRSSTFCCVISSCCPEAAIDPKTVEHRESEGFFWHVLGSLKEYVQAPQKDHYNHDDSQGAEA
jgi:hypothetical protein